MPGERKLTSLAAYDTALDELLANATHTVRIFDKTIGRNFNSPQRYELLGQLLLARRTNRVRIVLHETANIVRDCPRLMMLLQRFSYGLAIHQTLPAARRIYDPFAVADDTRFVRRFHYTDVRGTATIGDVGATSLLIKRFDELWEASAPSVAATTIGL
jgi:AraC-like DNA-binding protein